MLNERFIKIHNIFIEILKLYYDEVVLFKFIDIFKSPIKPVYTNYLEYYINIKTINRYYLYSTDYYIF